MSSPERLRYGTTRSARIDLFRPEGRGPAPLAVVLHGGYWRARYTKSLMAPLCRALAAHGWAAANVEYRRVGLGGGGGGWPATLLDVAAAVDHLAGVPGLDLDRVASIGHSAGGHLALWAAGRHRLPAGAPGAAPALRVTTAVSLAGVSDLVRGAELRLGAGAVAALMGGQPHRVPDDRYALASPAALLPLGVRQVLVHGLDDATVPASLSEAYVAAATAAGDDARIVALPGVDHMAVIAPEGLAWDAVREALDQQR